jgi:hypothetical protein
VNTVSQRPLCRCTSSIPRVGYHVLSPGAPCSLRLVRRFDPLGPASAVPVEVSACRLAERASEAPRAVVGHADVTRIVVHP